LPESAVLLTAVEFSDRAAVGEMIKLPEYSTHVAARRAAQ